MCICFPNMLDDKARIDVILRNINLFLKYAFNWCLALFTQSHPKTWTTVSYARNTCTKLAYWMKIQNFVCFFAKRGKERELAIEREVLLKLKNLEYEITLWNKRNFLVWLHTVKCLLPQSQIATYSCLLIMGSIISKTWESRSHTCNVAGLPDKGHLLEKTRKWRHSMKTFNEEHNRIKSP